MEALYYFSNHARLALITWHSPRFFIISKYKSWGSSILIMFLHSAIFLCSFAILRFFFRKWLFTLCISQHANPLFQQSPCISPLLLFFPLLSHFFPHTLHNLPLYPTFICTHHLCLSPAVALFVFPFMAPLVCLRWELNNTPALQLDFSYSLEFLFFSSSPLFSLILHHLGVSRWRFLF